MTEEEWKKYSEQHPNAKRENHTIVQKKSDTEKNQPETFIYDEEYDQYMSIEDAKKRI